LTTDLRCTLPVPKGSPMAITETNAVAHSNKKTRRIINILNADIS
jgi:hypothetical protein